MLYMEYYVIGDLLDGMRYFAPQTNVVHHNYATARYVRPCTILSGLRLAVDRVHFSPME